MIAMKYTYFSRGFSLRLMAHMTRSAWCSSVEGRAGNKPFKRKWLRSSAVKAIPCDQTKQTALQTIVESEDRKSSGINALPLPMLVTSSTSSASDYAPLL